MGRFRPHVVMVHGSAQGSEVSGDRHLAKQAALADVGWRVAVPDRPGYRRSPLLGCPDDVEADGKLVAELLDGGAQLAGHLLGGCDYRAIFQNNAEATSLSRSPHPSQHSSFACQPDP